MPKLLSEYEEREREAVAVLERANIRIAVEKMEAAPLCPNREKSERRGTCRKCDGTHGDHFRVTIARYPQPLNLRPEVAPSAVYAFDFWGAYSDTRAAAELGKGQKGRPFGKLYKAPDVIDCILSDMAYETTADEVYDEFGPMRPSLCLAIVDHARKLRDVIPDAVAEKARDVLEGRDEETAADADMTTAGG